MLWCILYLIICISSEKPPRSTVDAQMSHDSYSWRELVLDTKGTA